MAFELELLATTPNSQQVYGQGRKKLANNESCNIFSFTSLRQTPDVAGIVSIRQPWTLPEDDVGNHIHDKEIPRSYIQHSRYVFSNMPLSCGMAMIY